MCASFHCTPRSSCSDNQRCAECSGAAELFVRSILLVVLGLERKLVDAAGYSIQWLLYCQRMALHAAYTLAYHQKHF